MRTVRMIALLMPAALTVSAAACKPTRMAPPADSTGAIGTDELRRLEREAAALATASGCERSGDCRTAPVGVRPCGGPRSYLVYCARSTDSTALFRKLDELARAERAHNEREGLMGTCEFREAPVVVASGGSCRQAP